MIDNSYITHIADADKGAIVELVNGLRVPERFRAVYAEHPKHTSPQPVWTLDCAVEVTIEVIDGAPVVTQLSLRRPIAATSGSPFSDQRPRVPQVLDDPLAKRILNDAPLRKILDRIVAGAAAVTIADDGGPRVITEEEMGELEERARPFHRRVINDKLLRDVAAIVRANPETPNQAVAKQMHTSPRNATRWIKASKKFTEAEEKPDGQ